MSQQSEIDLTSLVRYLDEMLGIPAFPDYPGAFNGLQVEGRGVVRKIAAAVDASIDATNAVVKLEADLFLCHHGLLWGPQQPMVGRQLARFGPLIRSEISVYSAHLPVDAHPEYGNNAQMVRRMGLEPSGAFGLYDRTPIGWYADTDLDATELVTRVVAALGQPLRSEMLFGPDRCRRVGVISGGAGSMIEEARDAGVDFFVTGEGSHHTYFDARELGMNVVHGGHYATETFGVKALAAHLAERFGLDWEFIDLPTGL